MTELNYQCIYSCPMVPWSGWGLAMCRGEIMVHVFCIFPHFSAFFHRAQTAFPPPLQCGCLQTQGQPPGANVPLPCRWPPPPDNCGFVAPPKGGPHPENCDLGLYKVICSGWPHPKNCKLAPLLHPELAPSPRFADMAQAIRSGGRFFLTFVGKYPLGVRNRCA